MFTLAVSVKNIINQLRIKTCNMEIKALHLVEL